MTVRVPFGSGIGLDIVRSRHSSSAGGSIGEGLERRQEEGAQRLKGDGQLRRLAFRREEIPGGLLPFFERRLCVGGESQKIGRASCRERVCQYVWISVCDVSLKKKQITKHTSQEDKS